MGDLIKRQDAIDAISDSLKLVFVEHDDIAKRIINKVPSAEPKHGEWKMKWHSVFKVEFPCCSVCNNFTVFQSNYCPNCGARMEDA